MISNVGLPGKTGRGLAEVARAHHPDLPIPFVTGHAENAAIGSGFLGAKLEMITKRVALDVRVRKTGDLIRAPPARA